MSDDAHFSMNAHGVAIDIDGDGEAVRSLAVHFEGFAAPRSGTPAIRIALERGAPRLGLPRGTRADQIVDRGIVYNEGDITTVDHHGYASSVYDFATEHGTVRSERVSLLVELGYLAVSSRLGIHLERRGFVRVHGVGLRAHGRAALVLAPSGGGKSTLARALLRRDDVQLIGDDVVLLDRRGRAWPFPTPIGLTAPSQADGLGRAVPFPRQLHTPKWMIPVSDVSGRFATDPTPIRQVVLLVRVADGAARLVPTSRANAAAALFRDAVVGLGLPQVLELVARRGARDLVAQAPSAARRTVAVAAVVARAGYAELEVGPPADAAALLVDSLRGR